MIYYIPVQPYLSSHDGTVESFILPFVKRMILSYKPNGTRNHLLGSNNDIKKQKDYRLRWRLGLEVLVLLETDYIDMRSPSWYFPWLHCPSDMLFCLGTIDKFYSTFYILSCVIPLTDDEHLVFFPANKKTHQNFYLLFCEALDDM